MSIQDNVAKDPRGSVFDVLDDVRAGMLGLTGRAQGLQPMMHFHDAATGQIWFISSTHTELVESLKIGGEADYVAISADQDVHLSLLGTLSHVHDDAKLDELWNPVVSAWFEGGRSDPKIALLRFDPKVANIWAASTSALRFGFEILRANVDPEHRPDIGVKATVTFPFAA